MAILKARFYYHVGRSDSTITKALIEAFDASNGDVSEVSARLALPEPVVANLIATAASEGYITWGEYEDGLVLSEDILAALDEGRLDSELHSEIGSIDCELALDLSSGVVHDYDWIMDHRKTVEGLNDLALAQEVDAKETSSHLKQMRLRDLARASSLRAAFAKRDSRRRLNVDALDRIDDIEVENVTEVAVGVTEHHSREITRLLIQHDAPGSIIDSLVRKKPELFATRYELKETGEKWSSSEALVLLDRVDTLWERVHSSVFSSTSHQVRTQLARIAANEVEQWRTVWKDNASPKSDL